MRDIWEWSCYEIVLMCNEFITAPDVCFVVSLAYLLFELDSAGKLLSVVK
jgi:hypothetical protein